MTNAAQPNPKPTLMVSAGEASSDMHAAHALLALQKTGLEFDSLGMGAGQLFAAGMDPLVDCRELAVIGIVDVLINYPRFVKRLNVLKRALNERRPDLLLIVDYPDFNLKLAAEARKLGIPVLFYISPQVWAWRSKRVTKIGNLVDHMAVLFPFEVPFYENANIPVTYVGHPLIDQINCDASVDDACAQLNLDASRPVVALLPGSRNGELSRNLPCMLQTAERIARVKPDCQFILPTAATLKRQAVDEALLNSSVPVSVIEANTQLAVRAANAVVTASGTATLEVALLGTPMAIVYIINKINYAIMSRLIQIDNIGLVNIVSGKLIVKEFVQDAAQPVAIASEILRLLDDNQYREEMLRELALVKQKMGEGGASGNVALLITDMLNSKK
ncbi:MAG: lipid-A-disaccharide synthase [Granulosicoccaceae bacterium]